MALLEQEAVRFVESLDDYEHVTVTDIGGWGPLGYRVTVRDDRFAHIRRGPTPVKRASKGTGGLR